MDTFKELARLSSDVFIDVSESGEATDSILTMLHLHQTKPWVNDFSGVVIAPIRRGLEAYLKKQVFALGGVNWYYPSAKWWLAHARTSHAPNGSGCSVDAHTNFLTRGGSDAEFVYANVLKKGDVHVLGREDFEAECRWWARNFPEHDFDESDYDDSDEFEW